MDLNTIAQILAQPCPINAPVTGFCTDSRLVQAGNLFIVLEGNHFDGHLFIQQAAEQGAVAAIVKTKDPLVTIPQFVVVSPLNALAQIATYHRAVMECPVIALTGSNGKTSVKEMIAAILPKPSHATRGNLNNHIGAPLSVLALNPKHRYAVFELGANHAGEIAHTVAVVKPDVALINNIAPAHVAGFGSIDGVAQAKGEIYAGLGSNGIAIVNDDDTYAHFWDSLLTDTKTLRFSVNHVADVYARDVYLDERSRGRFFLVLPQGEADIQLQVVGMHNVRNAVAAAACCYAVGISLADIAQGLNAFGGVKGRMSVLVGKNEATIYDDTYNANLRSVLAGLDVLAQCDGDKIFVFGDMGELGEWAVEHHQEVGLAARRLGINQLVTCGSLSQFTSSAFGKGGHHFATHEEVVQYLSDQLKQDTTVLVKGSRSSAMEKIVQQLLN